MTGANLRPMPADFAEHATEGMNALMERYHAGSDVVRRWKELSGTLRHYNLPVIRTDADGNQTRYRNAKIAAKKNFADIGYLYAAIRNKTRAYGCKWRWEDGLES